MQGVQGKYKAQLRATIPQMQRQKQKDRNGIGGYRVRRYGINSYYVHRNYPGGYYARDRARFKAFYGIDRQIHAALF